MRPLPNWLRPYLADELSDEAVELLAVRTRIDRRLWEHVAATVIADRDLAAVREQAFDAAVARYEAALRRPAQTPPARRVVEGLYSLRAKLHRRR